MTPTGWRAALMNGDAGYRQRAARPAQTSSDPVRRLAPAERPRRAREREHLLVGQRAQQRVGDPVGAAARAPGHQLEAAAVVEELERAPARGHAGARVVEDRGRAPGGALHAVVLADPAVVGDDPIG